MPLMTLTVTPMEDGTAPYSIQVKGWEEIGSSLHRECVAARSAAEPGDREVCQVRVGGVEVKAFTGTWEQLGVREDQAIEVGLTSSAVTSPSPEGLAGQVAVHMQYTRQVGGGLNPTRYDKTAPESLFPRCAADGRFHPGQCHGVDGTGYKQAWWTCCQAEGEGAGVNTPGCCVLIDYNGPLGEAAHGWKGGSGAAPVAQRQYEGL